MIGKTNSATGGIKGEKLNLTLNTNQSSHEDIKGATITVNYADTADTYTWQGSALTIEVPAYVSYTVTLSDVTGYKTPLINSGNAMTAVPDNARSITATYQTEVVSVTLSASDSSSMNGTSVTINGTSYTYSGSAITVKIPFGTVYSIVPTAKTNYFTPASVTNRTAASASYSKDLSYVPSRLTVNITSNQGTDSTISAVKATVAYGSTSVQVSSGSTIAIPSSGTITVTFPAVTGYATPSSVTVTPSSSTPTATASGQYKTQVLTVTVVADEGSVSGYTITGKSGSTTLFTQTTSSATHKIAWGTSYTISATSVSGYTVSSVSGTANAATATATVQYVKIKAETLTVTVTGISSGYTVYVKNSSGTTLGSQTTASKTYSIEAGTKYYVTASSVSGYVTPDNSSTYTAVAGNTRSVAMTYVAHSGTTSPTNGVWIKDTDGYYHTASEWDGTYTALGIAVITDKCSFVMALRDAYSSTCRWGGYGTKVSGIATTTSTNTAAQDYAGESNTSVIINALADTNDGYADGAPAAEYCANFQWPDGDYSGYLGAAGEWQAALDNKSAITTALSACGGAALSSYYWTSTQSSSNYSWYMYWSGEVLYDRNKYGTNYVRAFRAI